jgi:periplasmic copper chaperone A
MKHLLTASLLFVSLAASAEIIIKDAWVRTTVAEQKVTGAFMQITSDKAVKLVAANSPAAETTEVHEMSMQGDVMKMRQVNEVVIDAGKSVELKPGSYHIMLMNLKKPVQTGSIVNLNLEFLDADGKKQIIKVKAEARAAVKQDAGHANHHGH